MPIGRISSSNYFTVRFLDAPLPSSLWVLTQRIVGVEAVQVFRFEDIAAAELGL